MAKYKNIVLEVYIHHGKKNCWSSKDYDGYKAFSTVKEFNDFCEKNRIKDISIIKENELSFYYGRVCYEHNRNRFYLQSILSETKPSIITEYYKLIKNRDNEKRKKDGFALYKSYDDLTKKDYCGSFSDKILKQEVVDNYISGPIVYGYFGSYERKLSFDKILEEVIGSYRVFFIPTEKVMDNYLLIGHWLTSRGARHFMDQTNDMTDDEFKSYLEKRMEELFLDSFSLLPEADYYEYEKGDIIITKL